jgi:hypothetical protein
VNVLVTTTRTFASTLNPAFVWEDLGENFRSVVFALLMDRKDREKSGPTRRLLDMDSMALEENGADGGRSKRGRKMGWVVRYE